MSLTEVVPAPYRWIAVIALVAAVFAVGWFKGSAHEKGEWDAEVVRERTAAVKLATIQQKGIDKANAAYAAGKIEDAKREADLRDAVRRRCGVVLPVGGELRGTNNPAPVPPVSPGRAERTAVPEDDGRGGVQERDLEDDIAMTCPALYRQAKWLRDLAIAGGADKP